MKKLKLFCGMFVCFLLVTVLLTSVVSAEETITLYSMDGRTIYVWESDVAAYKAVGWYDNIDDVRTTLYANGQTITVFNSEVETYLALGWHRATGEAQTTLYSKYGSQDVNNSEVDTYLALGWSLTPVKLDNITVLPVTFTKNSSYSSYQMTLEYFEMDGLYYYSYSDEIEINYYAYGYGDTSVFDLNMECYDSYGNFIKSVPFSIDNYWITVPGNTAWFIIKPSNNGYSTTSGEYFHCKQVDLYSMDGRSMVSYDVQVPKNTAVGWLEEVTLYALDGRTCSVPPHMVGTYTAVGWYTEAAYNYYLMNQEYDFYMASYNWEGAMDIVDAYMSNFYGTEYEWPAQQKKEKAMDKWRNSVKKPIVATDSYISGSGYSQKANITFKNLSYKTIIAFRLKFTCYNIFNEKINSYYKYYYCDDVYIWSGYSDTITWNLNIYDSVYSIKNIEIYDIVFSDGTMV